jgi:hypothetical protein
MKPLPLFLGVSVVANVALAVLVWLRISPASQSVRSGTDAVAAGSANTTAGEKIPPALRAALASGDPAALTAAGVPAETIRALTVGQAVDAFVDHQRAMQPKGERVRYWRNLARAEDTALGAERKRAEQNINEAFQRVYGEGVGDLFFSRRSSGRSVLAPATRARLDRIERDYEEMEQQITASQDGSPLLHSDREKLELLQVEMRRDLDAALTPAERELIALHDSHTAYTVRDRFGAVLETEEDYKKIFALQKAFDDRLIGSGTQESPESQRKSEQKLMDDIRAALGPEKWAAAQRAGDPDVRILEFLQQRLHLPNERTEAVLAARSRYAAQSQQINADLGLSEFDRKTQLQMLATRAKSDLANELGFEGSEAFAKQAGWISILQNGRAFSLDPADAPLTVGLQVGTRGTTLPPPRTEAPTK